MEKDKNGRFPDKTWDKVEKIGQNSNFFRLSAPKVISLKDKFKMTSYQNHRKMFLASNQEPK